MRGPPGVEIGRKASIKPAVRMPAAGEAARLVLKRQLLLNLVVGLLIGDSWAVFGLEFFGDLLDFAEDAQAACLE